MAVNCLIVDVMCKPERVSALSDLQWDLLIRQARRSDILAKLASVLEEQELMACVPEKAKAQLQSIQILATKHEQVIRWEVNRILEALNEVDVDVILLKGAAYLLADLPVCRGRLFSDVDILVPKDSLEIVERALLINGWISIKLSDYDQRYYRKWMQELPPLMHRRRQTVIDVHHRILPETSKAQPDAMKMIDNTVALNEAGSLRVLSNIDMVLHSATHLFYEGEFDHGLRDLLDLRDLITQFSQQSGFWEQLLQRAEELELQIPLYYATRYTHRLLTLPVPDFVFSSLKKPWHYKIMDILFSQALISHHQSCDVRFTGLIHWLLYVRSHYLRMPLYLLIPHLLRKALKGKDEED